MKTIWTLRGGTSAHVSRGDMCRNSDQKSSMVAWRTKQIVHAQIFDAQVPT